jgi:molybdenum cofactor biosynthesis enzyme MoaA
MTTITATDQAIIDQVVKGVQRAKQQGVKVEVPTEVIVDGRRIDVPTLKRGVLSDKVGALGPKGAPGPAGRPIKRKD